MPEGGQHQERHVHLLGFHLREARREGRREKRGRREEGREEGG
jgi:hypothetical protein